MPVGSFAAVVIKQPRTEMILQVRAISGGATSEEGAAIDSDSRSGPGYETFAIGLGSSWTRKGPQIWPRPAVCTPSGLTVKMILQVASNTREVHLHFDSELTKCGTRPNSGEHQQMRRVNGSTRQYNSPRREHINQFSSLEISHSHRSRPIEIYL